MHCPKTDFAKEFIKKQNHPYLPFVASDLETVDLQKYPKSIPTFILCQSFFF
jgi:hypothetical protein